MKDLTYAALAHGRCWAVEPQTAMGLWAELKLINAEDHMLEVGARAASAAAPQTPKPYESRADGVAVLYIDGVMTKRGASYGRACSTVRLRRAIDIAAADKDTKGILLVVDSPGGSCEGTQELADAVKAASAKKPVTVFIDDNCYSAAYWGTCTASRIVINRNGRTGSLGAMGGLIESSKAFEMAGLEMILFATGDLKGAGTPGTEVTEDQRAMFQKDVDDFGQAFVNTIASGRKMKRDDARTIFTGRIFNAQEAIDAGLVDEVGTLDSAIASMFVAQSSPDDMDDEDDGPDCQHLAKASVKPHGATVSPLGGSTGPVGAGTTTIPITGQGARNSMKELLVRALTRVGLVRTATSLVASKADDQEELAAVMASEVDAEVKDRVAKHPLMMACEANGITTVEALQKVLAMRNLGQAHLDELKSDAHAEAVRAYGAEDGPKIAAQVEHLSPDAITKLRDAWRTQADAKFGIPDKGAAARQTAPSGTVKVAADVETTEEPKSNWERLDEKAKAQAAKMGINTDAAKESYATHVLSITKGGE